MNHWSLFPRLTFLNHWSLFPRLTLWLVLSCASISANEGVLLVNRQVPLGFALAQNYQKLHPQAAMRMVEIDVAPLEKISKALFDSEVKPKLLTAFTSDLPTWILSFYGVPMLVEDGERQRTFDQLLTLLNYPETLNQRLVLNPLFFKEKVSWKPIPVCRLDGPALRHAELMLDSWAQLKNWGGWRRAFTLETEGGLNTRLALAGHPVYSSESLLHADLREVQWWESRDEECLGLLKDKSKSELFAPGSIALRRHSKTATSPSFRRGLSGAAKFVMHGGGFYVGALSPRQVEEDLFDAELFASSYLKGHSFVDCAYGAMPTLGGSLLVLGDPLARPYSPAWEADLEKSLNASEADPNDKNYAVEVAIARDWWLIRDYLKFWEQAKFEMVQSLLKVAIARRDSPLYWEFFNEFNFQLGRTDLLSQTWLRWPEAKKNKWVEHLATDRWGLAKK